MKALRQARQEYANWLGADHPMTWLVAAQQARLLWATRQGQQALALLDEAIPVLQKAMGDSAPQLIRLKSLREELAKPGRTSPGPAGKWNLFV